MPELRVDVWWARPQDAEPTLRQLVSRSDRERLDRYRRDIDRQRGLVAIALTRVILGMRLGLTPATVPIDRTCRICGCENGKPHVIGGPDFSVSHAGNAIAVAVMSDGCSAAVGVDIERVDDRPITSALLRRTLGEGERSNFPTLDRRLAVAFVRQWVRKEAVVKAVGIGLSMPFAKFTITPYDSPPELVTWPSDPTLPPRSGLVDLDDRGGHLASLAVVGLSPIDRPRLDPHVHDGSALLRHPAVLE